MDIQNYKKIRKELEKLKLLVKDAELWVQKLSLCNEGKGGLFCYYPVQLPLILTWRRF